jgi:hypothetical protein
VSEPRRGTERAESEHIPIRRAVNELEALSLTEQMHAVVSDDIAAAHGVDANLRRTSRPWSANAPMNDGAARPGLDGDLRQAERRATRCVDLASVMGLDDLDVEAFAERRDGVPEQAPENVNSDAHVRFPEHGDAPARVVERTLPIGGQARGAAHERRSRLCDQSRELREHLARGKVDGDVEAARSKGGQLSAIDRVHDRNPTLAREPDDRRPHPSARTDDGEAQRRAHARPRL